MDTPQSHIGELLVKHLNGNATISEMKLINEWLNRSEENKIFYDSILNKDFLKEKVEVFRSIDMTSGWQKVQAAIKNEMTALTEDVQLKDTISYVSKRRIHFMKTAWIRYAAAIILIFGVGAYIWTTQQRSKPGIVQSNPVRLQKDVPSPQAAHAVITLGNGQQIILDSAGNGTLAMEGNIRVAKLADGQVTYSGNATVIEYHTLTNPKGSRVVNITLADGTKVWLNAASSLRYPNAFAEKDRNVSVTGEAYFEVAHNASSPFVVSKGSTAIRVLGTHFNVNTYEDEDGLAVTLLEGSVRVQHEKAQQILSYGQQAQVKKDGTIFLDRNANIEEIMAWKNGMFRFNKTDLRVIMRQIEKWYNVEIVYESGVKPQLFNGEIPRDVAMSEVLNILQYTGAHFKIEENKITVLP